MSEEPLPDDFLSRDRHRIWHAASAVRTCHDPDRLRALGRHADRIERETRGIPLGGLLRPNALHLGLALRILRAAVADGGCTCRFWPRDEMYDLFHLARPGHATHDEGRIDRAAYTAEYRARCTHCGAAHAVTEVHGHHYPVWRWRAAEPD